ncbi:MAG: DUF1127 domain-containing protein [Hoeflea sp.]|uniref:DUF1127 domain-containing protein n=1 Tax=Hoeflea sp. TaxID=1940281 RepID=UPI003EF25501
MHSTLLTGKVPSRHQASGRDGRDTGTPARAIIGVVGRWWRAYCRWDDRLRQRRHLGALDDRLLDDIGVTARHARQEASRWFMV